MSPVASVDARTFEHLTLLDRSAVDIRARALADVATALPELDLRRGTNEYVLAEAMALEVAEAVWAINRVPQAVAEGIFQLLDVERDLGAPAVTSVTFTMVDAAGHTVPAGTRVRLDLSTGPVVFTLDTDAVAAATETTATATATATVNGATANGTAAGSTVHPLDTLYFVEAAELATVVSGGRDPEGTADWMTRARQRLARLSDSLVLPGDFTAYALENPAVTRATTIDLFDGDGTPAGTDTGHVTVVVYGAGATVSPADKAALQAEMGDRAVANLEVHVIDPTVTTVDVEVDVTVTPGADTAEVEAAVEAALEEWLNPETWPWEATVRFFDAVAVIEGVSGVDHIDAGTLLLDEDTADVALTGAGPLAAAGTITVSAS